MTQETAARLVEENLTAIYGYARAHLYDRSRAEDLAADIILAILQSAENLRDEKAFWGFAWRIAENTFRTFIRRERLVGQCLSLEAENLVEVLVAPEETDREEQDHQINRLRRELSLLGRRHRDICVSYYIHNKSCSAIAEEQHISVNMVKQHLFKARKQLKEGMEMERKFGEKSYNPGTFRLDFWGDWNHYAHICDRKLPGAILLAAYGHPMTAEELSVEVGVAMPYLEDEIENLTAAGLLAKHGKHYETAIVILKNDREKAFAKEIQSRCTAVAESLCDSLKSKLPQVRALSFRGNDYDDARLLYALLNIAFIRGYEWSNFVSPTAPAPALALGGNGWVFGCDNNYENHHFRGIATHISKGKTDAWFTAVNYRALLAAQDFGNAGFRDKAALMSDAILEKPASDSETLAWLIENGFVAVCDGCLTARFPVFEEDVYEALLDILRPDYEAVAATMIEISGKAEAMLSEIVPSWLKPACADIAKIHHRMDVAAFILESLIDRGILTVPQEKIPLTVFGVKRS